MRSEQAAAAAVWMPDLGNGRFKNPVLFADYADPDVIRVGGDFYMVSSSFNCIPGLPILHSCDLVNWTIVNHAIKEGLPFEAYQTPAHAKGVWAPSIRYHDGKFMIFFATPDEGIFMTEAADPLGDWSRLVLVKEAKGWIDPCPFWDEDGQAYMVVAFAGSRAGIKSVLKLCRMKPDGTELLDEGELIFDGREHHPTIEGPKMYKRNGFYYLFCPAGGVTNGWQTILRSRHIYGPYEDKIVMHQGDTDINGPHQGGWLELDSGESWFLHFQDRDAYGRILHLNPVHWVDDWPLMGVDTNGDGIGEPVSEWRKPDVGESYAPSAPAASDEFDGNVLGLQWQWQANRKEGWYSLGERESCIRLFAEPVNVQGAGTLLEAPHLLLQKLSAPVFCATAKLTLTPASEEDRAGLVIMGYQYACLTVSRCGIGFRVSLSEGNAAEERELASADIGPCTVFLRVSVEEGAVCRFSYSLDGNDFRVLGEPFTARPGGWMGAKAGLFHVRPVEASAGGYADVDYFRLSAHPN
jgi:beta-xylosidase